MWTKNILEAFAPDTPVRLYINGRRIEDVRTVQDYMASGLLTYTTTEPGALVIEAGAIVVRY